MRCRKNIEKRLTALGLPRRMRVFPAPWGHSSAGRAPAWHAGGQRFDPAWLHHFYNLFPVLSPSSRGLGHYPFTVATGVRIPVGTPLQNRNMQATRKRSPQGGRFALGRVAEWIAGVRGRDLRPEIACRTDPPSGTRVTRPCYAAAAGVASHGSSHAPCWLRACRGFACRAPVPTRP